MHTPKAASMPLFCFWKHPYPNLKTNGNMGETTVNKRKQSNISTLVLYSVLTASSIMFIAVFAFVPASAKKHCILDITQIKNDEAIAVQKAGCFVVNAETGAKRRLLAEVPDNQVKGINK